MLVNVDSGVLKVVRQAAAREGTRWIDKGGYPRIEYEYLS
jgi:hypothetical protein